MSIEYNFKLVNFSNEALSIKRGKSFLPPCHSLLTSFICVLGIGASEFPRSGGRGFSKFVKASIVTLLNGFIRNDALVLELELKRYENPPPQTSMT